MSGAGFWRSKPPPGVQLDRAHPLTRQLRAVVPFNEQNGTRVANLVQSEYGAVGPSVRYRIPYSEDELLTLEEKSAKLEQGKPLHFGHSLADQLGGQLDAGLRIAGFYEDAWEPGVSAISDRIPCFAATLALKL